MAANKCVKYLRELVKVVESRHVDESFDSASLQYLVDSYIIGSVMLLLMMLLSLLFLMAAAEVRSSSVLHHFGHPALFHQHVHRLFQHSQKSYYILQVSITRFTFSFKSHQTAVYIFPIIVLPVWCSHYMELMLQIVMPTQCHLAP